MDPNTNVNEFLEAAKAAIAQAGAIGAETAGLRKEREEAENRVNGLKKDQSEQIADTCRRRRAEIDKTYGAELDKCNVQLKKAQQRREKARNQGMKERIADETADIKADIKAINARIRADFKAEHVPGWCNSRFFGALYFPDGLGDVLIIIISFAVAFFVIPYGMYKLFFDGSIVALVIIYILDVLLFGGIYIGISRHTVMEHADVLRQAKLRRREIREDRRKIQSIIRSIEEDENESCYDLAQYDDEIAHIRQQLADITMKKNEAVSTFENVTRNIIADEIISAGRPAIDDAEKRLGDVTARFTAAEAARKQKTEELAGKYEPYLGREFMSITRIERLQAIISHGTSTNISEAIEEYNRQYDI